MKSSASGGSSSQSGSHPVRGAWIEMSDFLFQFREVQSHPVRGAWIEILKISIIFKCIFVAPREGCVD